MKGMIFIPVQDFIEEALGDEIYYEIMDRSKLQTKDPFITCGYALNEQDGKEFVDFTLVF